jgi:hypothetical protein
MIIILDAINQLPSEYHDLRWLLPRTLPPRVHIIFSTSEGEVVKSVEKRGNVMKILHVNPLNDEEKRELIAKRLAIYGKAITKENTVSTSFTHTHTLSLSLSLFSPFSLSFLSLSFLYLSFLSLSLSLSLFSYLVIFLLFLLNTLGQSCGTSMQQQPVVFDHFAQHWLSLIVSNNL